MAQLEVYIVDPASIDPARNTALLEGDEAHHLLRVRRARPGDEVMLIDGMGTAWPASFQQADSISAILNIGDPLPAWNEPGLTVHLGLGLLKADHVSDAINLAVQAGVASVTPLETRYSVAGWTDKKASRAERIARTAAKQCGRGLVPPLHPVQPLDKWCIEVREITHRILLDGDGGPLPEMNPGEQVALAIGPEGGFHNEELGMLEDAGFQRVRLGDRRLRSETAVAVGVSHLILTADLNPNK